MFDLLLILMGVFLGIGIERDILRPRSIRNSLLPDTKEDCDGDTPQPRPAAEC